MIFFFLVIILLSTLTLMESVDRDLIPPGSGFVIFLILFVLAASRPVGLDNDSGTYMIMFGLFDKPVNYFTELQTWVYFEPLYYLIPSFLKYTLGLANYGELTLYFFAFLGCGIVMMSLRQVTHYYYASLLTLFCNYFLLHQMTQIRSAVAVGLFLFCIIFRVQKQWGPFFICVLISFLFHYSSVLALLLLLFSNKSVNRPLYLSLAIGSLLLSFIDFDWVLGLANFDAGALAQKQEAYITDVQSELQNRRNYIFLIHLLNSIFLIIYAKRLAVYNSYIYLLIKIQVTGLILFQIFSASPAISERVADYYWATHLVTLPAFLSLFRIKIWPALALCLLNILIFLTLIYRNQIFHLEYLA